MLKEYVVLFVDPVDPVMVEGFLCEAEDQMHASEQATDAYPEYQVVWEGFLCEAEDQMHASEQATDAYPEYQVVWIEEGTDWAKVQDNYFAYHLTNQ